MGIGNFLVAGLMLGTLGVLIAGVVVMSVGGKLNAKYSNRLMAARVSLQGLALLALALLFMVGNK